MSDYFLTYLDQEGVLHLKRQLESVVAAQVKEFSQIREIKAYKGQANMPGFFYMTRTKRLVAYESRLEMFVLMQLDYNPSTAAVISQPLILHVVGGRDSFEHIPDFLVISVSEDITVVDVKPEAFVETEKNIRIFNTTADACASVGWDYTVQKESNRLFIENLQWLAGYRRFFPTVDAYATELIEACQKGPLPLQELVSNVGPSYFVRPVLFHLLWHRLLEIDMYAQLNNNSVVDLPREAFRRGV